MKVKGHEVGGRNFLGPGPPYCKATTPQLKRKTPFTGESGSKKSKNFLSPIGLLHVTHPKKFRQTFIFGAICLKKFRLVEGPLAPHWANFQLIRRTVHNALTKKSRFLPFFGGPIFRFPPGGSRCNYPYTLKNYRGQLLVPPRGSNPPWEFRFGPPHLPPLEISENFEKFQGVPLLSFDPNSFF